MKAFLENIRARIAAAMERLLGPVLRRAGAVLAPWTAQARARYEKLEARERLLLRVLAVVFGAFFIYDFVYLPVGGLRGDLRASIQQRHEQLGEVQALVGTYLQRKAELKRAEQRSAAAGRNFSLFSALEKTLTKSVGRDHLASITPRPDRKLPAGLTQHSVELSLSSVSLTQIVDALYGVRRLRAPVAVSSIHITRRTGDTHSYDVDMTCVAVSRNG